jgi:hypothetical protein
MDLEGRDRGLIAVIFQNRLQNLKKRKTTHQSRQTVLLSIFKISTFRMRVYSVTACQPAPSVVLQQAKRERTTAEF